MIEITPRFGQPLNLPKEKGDLGASEFQSALKESDTHGPDGQRQGTVPPQSQFVYADANGTSGTTGTLAQGQVTAPKSAKRPDLEKIANDPVVSAEIDKAWT